MESGGCIPEARSPRPYPSCSVARKAGPGSGSSRWRLWGPLQPASEDVSSRMVLEVEPHGQSVAVCGRTTS